MVPTIKAEVRKLLTVRSTYVITALSLALVIFFSFYISGWRADALTLHNPGAAAAAVTGAVGAVSVFAALVAVLLCTHEYRYSTIMYTLTASNSRSKVLLAKLLVITAFSAVFTPIMGVCSPLMAYLGMSAHHLTLVPQTIHVWDVAWRALFYGWGYGMAGLLLAFLIHSQIGTIATLFIAPNTVEAILSLLLKKNTVYLPFTSLDQVLNLGTLGGGSLTPAHAAEVFLLYLAVGWAIAWFLFLRRDAN